MNYDLWDDTVGLNGLKRAVIDYLIGLAASPCYCSKGMLADQKALIHNSKELAVKYVEQMHWCGILAPKVYLNLNVR